MDFGPIAEGHLHERYLTMVNRNPLTIFVEKIRFSSPECGQDTLNSSLKLVPLKLIDIMSNKLKRDYSNEDKVFDQIYELEESKDTLKISQSISESTDFMIPPNSIVVFKVQVDKPILPDDAYCSRFEATLYFLNFQSPDFEIPIVFEILKGNVTLYPSDLIKFPPAIPGILQRKEIYAMSSLRKKIFIKSVHTSNPEILTTRILEHQLDSRTNTSIIEVTTVGVIQTNSFLKMKNSAIFQHLSHRLSRKHQFESGSGYYNEPKLTYLDILAWQVNEKEWEQKQTNHETESTYLLTIETNAVQNLTVPVQTIVTKPSLLTYDVYDFGNVEVDTDKNGKIVVHNPSPNAMEVSFFIAPPNFLQIIIDELLSDEKLIKWKHICDKSTFFNPYGRKMCEGLIELHSLTSEEKKSVVDYFIRNYFTFITNGDIQDEMLSRFISDQQLFLQNVVQNISDATNSIKPPLKKEISKQEEGMLSIYSTLSKVRFTLIVDVFNLAKERNDTG
jgi:hypothetical protein